MLRYRSKLVAVEEAKTWLARIAWRVAVDRSHQRRSQREICFDDPEKPVAEPTALDAPADQVVQDRQVNTVLERMIAALPAKLREPLILSTLEELSPREVGATLGINESAVRSRVFRARQILGKKLTEKMGKGRWEP